MARFEDDTNKLLKIIIYRFTFVRADISNIVVFCCLVFEMQMFKL